MAKTLFWLLVLVLLAVSGVYLVSRVAPEARSRDGDSPLSPGYLACTEDAKVCDDGSSVGRDPSKNCEFYPCPAPAPDVEEQVVCTQEAKVCADGSAVGRQNDRYCAFAPCPGEGTVVGTITLDPSGDYDGELLLSPTAGGIITTVEVYGGKFYATLAPDTYEVSTGRVLPKCEGSFTVRANEAATFAVACYATFR